MGLPALNRVMSMQQDRRDRQVRCRVARRKGSPGQQDDDPRGSKRMRSSVPELPRDIWHDILSRLPLPDAAQASCVSSAFLFAWRLRPSLTLSEETLGLTGRACERDKLARIFTNRVDNIMRTHSGVGLKTFTLSYCDSPISPRYLDRWLRMAVTSGVEELALSVPRGYDTLYNFPCLLFNGNENSIRRLDLSRCAFHPWAGLGCLTRLRLSEVHVTGHELEQLLSNSLAMEELELVYCDKIISLKIPRLLHRLNCLTVFGCRRLKVIANKAPNVRVLHIDGTFERLRVGDLLQVRELEMIDAHKTSLVYHARAKLPFIMPNLETLNLHSEGEKLSTPILAAKFINLRKLEIFLADGDMRGFSYDYFSLVYFLDACPVLEDFVLCMPECHHSNLKNVKIMGFCSAKSLVELTCHILENATSLECLTLDAIYDNNSRLGVDRSCLHKKYGECRPVIESCMIAHAHSGLWAIGKYIVEKVPSTVKLHVKKLCSRCHRIV